MDKNNIFVELEKVLEEPISTDIVKILLRSGFDSKLSISGLNSEIIKDIEQFANEDSTILKETSYENMEKFMFKPGHKLFLLRLAKKVNGFLEKASVENQKTCNFSTVLRTFIETAEVNKGKSANNFRYDKINRYFATFIYLFCGRACYDTLSANLPIPQATTIRKSILNNFSLKCVI